MHTTRRHPQSLKMNPQEINGDNAVWKSNKIMQVKNKLFLYISVFLLFSITACHKTADENQDPCSGQTIIPWALNGRFSIKDSSLYRMTYDTSGSNAVISLWAYFNDPCKRDYATANIHITGNISTIPSQVYMGYCPEAPDEEIPAPPVWSGHWYERNGSMKKNIKDCASLFWVQVWIRTTYTFKSKGSRYYDYQYLINASEELSYSVTYSN